MLAGELYLECDPVLVAERRRARALLRRYNQTDETAGQERRRILEEMLGTAGRDLEIEPPLHCDYGYNIRLGDGVYLGVQCVLLDAGAIRVGSGTMLGPGVHIYTSDHPREADRRAAGPERALPVAIGGNVWIGGGAILCPGVTIGDGTTIGAGSVVTRNIPAGVVAAGNPCTVIRSLVPGAQGMAPARGAGLPQHRSQSDPALNEGDRR